MPSNSYYEVCIEGLLKDWILCQATVYMIILSRVDDSIKRLNLCPTAVYLIA